MDIAFSKEENEPRGCRRLFLVMYATHLDSFLLQDTPVIPEVAAAISTGVIVVAYTFKTKAPPLRRRSPPNVSSRGLSRWTYSGDVSRVMRQHRISESRDVLQLTHAVELCIGVVQAEHLRGEALTLHVNHRALIHE